MLRVSRSLPTIALAATFAALMYSLAVLGIELTRFSGRLATVWLANGVIIALVLRQPRERWPLLLAGSFLGNVAAGLTVGDSPPLAVVLAGCNHFEICVACFIFERRMKYDEPITTLAQIGWLGLLAIVGPMLSMPLVGFALAAFGTAPDPNLIIPWLVADVLGIMVVTPLLLTLTGPRATGPDGRGLEFVLLAILSAGATSWVFTSESASLFLVTPLLVLAAIRLRLDRAAMLVVMVCAIGVTLTLLDHGPWSLAVISESERNYLLQLFVATAVMLTLPIAALNLERQRATADLRAREEQYRLLADHGSDLVLRLSAQGQAEFISSASIRLLGVEPIRLRGSALARRIHIDDLPRFVAALDRVRRNGEAVACFRMRHERGDDRWIEAHLRTSDGPAQTGTAQDNQQVGADGRCRSDGAKAPCEQPAALLALRPQSALAGGGGLPIIASLRDVHQRRSAEIMAAENAVKLRETNRLLLMAEELAALGHWMVDPVNRQIILSAEAAMLLDLPQVVIGPSGLLAMVDRHDRRDLLRSVVLARRRPDPAECVVRAIVRDTERTFLIRLQLSGEDRTPGLFGVISDITDKLAAQSRLVAALQEARSAALFRSQFLATMSHEIRTPMTGVIGMIELLSGDMTYGERQIYLDTLRQSADVVMAVLNDILDFSKVDAGHIAIADQPFDLGLSLQTTLRLFDRAASSRGLDLRMDFPEPGRIWLRGDALRLQQVVSNLLANAIKFSERGEVALRCTLQGRARGRQAVQIMVEDRGTGIPADILDRLFEPFVQGSSDHLGGTGLGLAISRRLIHAMGGTLEVKSEDGLGSTFTIALDLAAAEPLPAPRPADAPPVVARSLDLLLAEDNPVNQLLVTALLKRMGHRVTCAADGELALLRAEERRFDLIFMDMQMPRRDGLSTAKAIRGGTGPNARTPIIALTADAAAERRSLYTGNGIDALLTKPIGSAALAAALASHTGGDRSPRSSVEASRISRSPLDEKTLSEVRSMLGQARLEDLLKMLASELEARPKSIREALADHDLERAAAEAHSLKGAAANLGAGEVAQAAASLEDAIAVATVGNRSGIAPAIRNLAEAIAATQHILALRNPGQSLAIVA